MNYQPSMSGAGVGGDLIPSGTLALAVVKVTDRKHGKGEFAKLELTLANGKFARRKLFVNFFANPDDAGWNETTRNIASGQVIRSLEAAGVFNHADGSGYRPLSFGEVLSELNGKTIAIKVGIEKGQDGYEDKNKVAEYLSPNPASRTHKVYAKAVEGETGEAAPAVAVAAPAFGGGFGGAAPSALSQPGWAGSADGDEPPF
jgi:hypothetical protein